MRSHQKTRPDAAFWVVVHAWLDACGIRINRNYLKEEITTHPDYPSLLSIIDLLDSGGMAYRAIHADNTYIHTFNYPLLAHIRRPGDERMSIISNAAEWDQHEEITRYWSGIVIYPERNARWENPQHAMYNQREKKNRFIKAGFLLTGLVLLLLTIGRMGQLFPAVFGFLSLTGLTLSLLALGTELGFRNDLVKQVCGAISAGGCEQVLKSRFARGLGGITPADASVLYFGSQYILYIISGFQPLFSQGIYLFAFAGVAVAASSIYLQAVKLKQWCALCLAIVTVLVLQGILAWNGWRAFTDRATGDFLPELIFMAVLFFLTLVLLPLKQLLKANKRDELKLAELKKWKQDAELFLIQWRQEQKADTTTWKNDLLLGSSAAPLLITVACNPYCGPCSTTHHQLDELLTRQGDKVKMQIRLVFPAEDAYDRKTIAVKALLQRANAAKSKQELQLMLTDWFAWMDYDEWVVKWQPDQDINVDSIMRQHYQWVEDCRIAHTPTLFINGQKLPGKYTLDDLVLLVPALTALSDNEMNTINANENYSNFLDR
jgi:uncharacterized membrane protein